jgi:DNA-binding MarR family transcriptional regulator
MQIDNHTWKGDYGMGQWKEIKGTDGSILVSNTGHIKSLLKDGRILKSQSDSKGYQRVRVTIEGRKLTFKVHREVAKAFLPNPQKLPQVNHIDGNKRNNAATNLEWVTNQENARHAIANGLWKNVIAGAKRENESRMRKIQGRSANGEFKVFRSVSEAERFLNSRHISDVLKHKRTHVKGWTFEYCSEGGGAE